LKVSARFRMNRIQSNYLWRDIQYYKHHSNTVSKPLIKSIVSVERCGNVHDRSFDRLAHIGSQRRCSLYKQLLRSSVDRFVVSLPFNPTEQTPMHGSRSFSPRTPALRPPHKKTKAGERFLPHAPCLSVVAGCSSVYKSNINQQLFAVSWVSLTTDPVAEAQKYVSRDLGGYPILTELTDHSQKKTLARPVDA
jgi:hypothetical protein